MRNLLLLLLIAFTLGFSTGCGKDEPATLSACTATAASQDVADAWAEFEVALTNYAADQSVANCEAYKREAQDYLNVLKRFENCAGIGDTQEWRESIREAEEELAMTPC